LLERGRVFNSYGNPAQACALFMSAWEAAQAAGEDAYAVDAAHMMAIVEPAEQQMIWNLRALELAQQSLDERARRWQGSLYNNIGWTYHDMGQYDRALEMFQHALVFRQAQGQPAQIRIARWSVARAMRSLGRTEEALAMQQQLLEEHEHAGMTDGYVLEELGECLLALGRSDEARPYFARAYATLSDDPWLAQNEPARLERLKQLSHDGA
jgi:tetratricopeptide (TPR) repeat protein